MGWFCLLWTLLFVVSVSSQKLSTLLPRDDDACMRNEVTFTCTVRGSLTLTDLILAWGSTEYIGQGDALRFTSENMPGMNNMSRMINGNVTATLTSNTNISGVPELVSELRIIGADRSSEITCRSETNGTSNRTIFVSTAIPGSPQGGEAIERSARSCDFLVAWDPPTNIDISDIGSYRIYVPSRNIMNISSSTAIDLTIPNCRVGNNSVLVAAVNRFGCVGPNSTSIQLTPLEMPPSNPLPTPNIAGIAVGVAAFSIIVIILMLVVVIFFGCYRKVKRQQLQYEKMYAGVLLELMKKIPPSDIKEVLMTVLRDTEVVTANSVKAVLKKLRQDFPEVISTFDNQLREADSSVTMKKLIEVVEEGEHKKRRDELIKQVDNAPPETVKDNLRKLFEALSPQERGTRPPRPPPPVTASSSSKRQK